MRDPTWSASSGMVGRISTGMGWNHAAAISRSASRDGACWGLNSPMGRKWILRRVASGRLGREASQSS